MNRHLSLSNLLGLLEGRLAAEEATAATKHLEKPCHRCLAERTWLERLLEVTRSDRTQPAPAEVIRRAVALFGWLGPKKKGIWGKVFALKPRFDSALVPQPAGLRGETSTVRRLLYEIGPMDLDLEIIGGARKHVADVRGQLLHRELGPVSGMTISLLRANKKIASCPCSGRGEFEFAGIRAADYRLEAQVGRSRQPRILRGERRGQRRFTLKSVPLRSSTP